MKNRENEDTKKIALIIEESIHNIVTEQEAEWINKIESLRNILGKDTSTIEVRDFGAGDPDSNRSDKEMYEGVIHTTTVSSVCIASKPPFWALILFKLVRTFQSQTIIELGTCLGISAAYQASAQLLNRKGKLITMEGSDTLAKLSEKNLEKLGLNQVSVISGRFQDNLESVLEENTPVDYVFIDGHHDEKATIDYFNFILPYLSEKSILVFDDISWSDGMRSAWKKIIEHDQIKLSFELKMIGICILDKNQTEKESFIF